MGKKFVQVFHCKCGLEKSYDILKRVIADQKLRTQRDRFWAKGYIRCREREFTKTAVHFLIERNTFEDKLILKITAHSNAIPIMQIASANGAMDNFIKNFQAYDDL